MSTSKLFKKIKSLKKEKAILFVGIDGCGGVGKTTLAENIQKKFKDVSVVHMDNFDLPFADRVKGQPHEKPVGADTDWARLEREVILPLKNNQSVKFQKYSWDKDRMLDWESIKPAGIIIVEGVYSLRIELRDHFDLKIWIDCPLDVRLKRGLERDGEDKKDRWLKDWLPMEERYMALHHPEKIADIKLITG